MELLFLVPLLRRFPISAKGLIQDTPLQSKSWDLLSTTAGGEFQMDLNLFYVFGTYDITAQLISCILRCPVIALARGEAKLHTPLSCNVWRNSLNITLSRNSTMGLRAVKSVGCWDPRGTHVNQLYFWFFCVGGDLRFSERLFSQP